MRIPVTRSVSIDDSELAESFVHASGPGGQNVNKVSTAVELRLDAATSPSLPPDRKPRLPGVAGRQLTNEGILIVFAPRFRSQDRNRDDARARLVAILAQAAIRPIHRRPTKPTHGSKLRRLQAKNHRSKTKQTRGRLHD